MPNARIAAALAAIYLIWGSTFLAMRVALESLPPLTMCGLRYAIAGLLMYGFLRARGAAAPSAREWLGSLLVAVLLLVVGNAGVAIAEAWVPSSVCAILFATIPLWTALFSSLFGRRVLHREWLGLGVGSLGVTLLHLDGDLRARPLGAALVITAAAGMALGSVWMARLRLPAGAMASAAQLVCGGGLLLGLGVLRGEEIEAVSLRSAGALAYLVVFGSIVGFSAYGFLLRRVRPALATSYAYVNPIVAVLLGGSLAGERIGAAALSGMATILLGLGLVALARLDGRRSIG
jgi:drug/metabolite transporter (DMT)-like permease